MKLGALFAVALMGYTPSAGADNYEVSVTRKGANLYKVDGRDILVRTRYCYEQVTREA